MQTIKENYSNEININKSRFITKLIKIDNTEDVKNNLEKIKKQYKDATHYCYAYIISANDKGFNDDGEPNKTAGMPILNVLENNNLIKILCVVVRYFGGMKLGAGGLVRAYTKAASECLNKSQIVKLIPGKKIKLLFNYSNLKQIDYLLSNVKIINKDFNNQISYVIIISNDTLKIIKEQLLLNCNDVKELMDTIIEQ